MTERQLFRLEDLIGRLLRLGVAASTALLAIGLGLWFAALPAAGRVLHAGLIVLMVIPISRIVASFADALRRRDRLLSWSTGAVLLILSVTVVYSLWGR